jgi:hypothetical protein
MTTLNDLAPWPSEDDTTAASLLKYFTAVTFVYENEVSALTHAAFNDDATDDDKRRYSDACHKVVAGFGEVLLLRSLIEVAPEKADDIARDLRLCLIDGSVIPELLWEWMVESGIDPEQVKALAAADRSEHLKAAS